MSENQRGKRDGTGPMKGSYQDKKSNKGKRQEAGQDCPVKPVELNIKEE